jgi:hypothetical protein
LFKLTTQYHLFVCK